MPNKNADKGLIFFLATERSKEELRIAFDIAKEFAECESTSDWFGALFSTWQIFELYLDTLRFLLQVELDKISPERLAEFTAFRPTQEET